MLSLPLTLLLAGALSAPLSPLSPPDFNRDPQGTALDGQVVSDLSTLRFLRVGILPDRTTGWDWGLRYLRQGVEDLNRLAPDVVFTIGDMIQGYTRDQDEWKRQADEYLEIVRPLRMPLFPIAGNHDVISGTRRPGDSTFADLYRTAFGPLWYSVDLERLTVVVMFSDESLGARGLRVSDEQLAWLDGALQKAKSRAVPIVVLMHRPLWRSPSVQWPERVQPLLERAGVGAVIAGHFHSMQRDATVGGIQYHILGTCGGGIDQHPYAGQMQHLSFLDVFEDGTLRFFHTVVGTTLDSDWVMREDQDRVYKLRFEPGVTKWLGAFPDPYMSTAPQVGEVVLEFRNPLDVPVEVSFDQIRSEPTPWIVGRENFLSWTPVDTFNPHTTAIRGPFNISALPPHPVAPGDVTQLPVRLRTTPVATPLQPPPIELRIDLLDRRSRNIPVIIPLRVPIVRSMLVPDSLDLAQPFPICVWDPSPYDRAEPDPTCRIALRRGDAGDSLLVEVRVPDGVRSAFAEDERALAERLLDPIADAVRIRISTADTEADCLVSPFEARTFGSACTAEAPELWPDGKGWTLRVRVPWPGGRFNPTFGDANTVNVGVADNDDTYHTQWRWLAPTDHPVAVRLGTPSLEETLPPRQPRPPRRRLAE